MYALFVGIYGQIREHQFSFSDGKGKNEKGEDPILPSPAKMLDKVLPPVYPSPVLLRGCHKAACVPHGAVQEHQSCDTVTQHPLHVQQQHLEPVFRANYEHIPG